jgi:hypothetical protein
MSHHASCSCGQLYLDVEGEPVRVSVCHCLACQQRTGSAFGAQVRFPRDQVDGPHGSSTAFTRAGDSGGEVTFHFCPICGTTLYWLIAPNFITVTLGAFADPKVPWSPKHSVYEERAHPWSRVPNGPDVEHMD